MFGITFAIFKTALDWWWNISPPFCRAFARSNLKVLCCARSCNSWPLEGATLWAILKGTSFLTSYDVWNRNLPSLERGTSFGSMASLIRRHHPHQSASQDPLLPNRVELEMFKMFKTTTPVKIKHILPCHQPESWVICIPRNLRWK